MHAESVYDKILLSHTSEIRGPNIILDRAIVLLLSHSLNKTCDIKTVLEYLHFFILGSGKQKYVFGADYDTTRNYTYQRLALLTSLMWQRISDFVSCANDKFSLRTYMQRSI